MPLNKFTLPYVEEGYNAPELMNILKTAGEAAGEPILTVDEFRSLFGYPPLEVGTPSAAYSTE